VTRTQGYHRPLWRKTKNWIWTRLGVHIWTPSQVQIQLEKRKKIWARAQFFAQSHSNKNVNFGSSFCALLRYTWCREYLSCRNPTLAKCGGEAQHLEKLEIWSPLGLPNVQSSTERPQTPCIEVFLVSLERSWNVDIENGLALAIWTSAAQVMGKRRARSQTATKSQESTSSRRSNWECDTALERSRRGLQLWFKPHHDQTPQSGVMAVQSSRSLAGTVSGLHFGSPNKMCHLDVASAASCRKYYRGVRWWLTPESGLWWVLCVQVPVASPNTQGCPEC